MFTVDTPNRTTCKNCGSELKWALPCSESLEKSKIGSALALIFKVIKVFFVIVIPGAIAIVILYTVTFQGCGDGYSSAARGTR